jgi:hypothetical protein
MTLSCFADWKNYTMRKQLIITSFGILAISLVIASIISSVYVYIITTNIRSQSQTNLLDESKNNMLEIIRDSTTLLTIKLNVAVENFLGVISFATEDSFRNDYPFNNQESYYDWPDTLSKPNNYVPMYNTFISYAHSSYNVYNKSPNDIQFFSSNLNNTIIKTATLDPILTTAYLNSDIFIAGYIGMEESGFFREYPGATNINTNLLKSYDPKKEQWYIDSLVSPKKYILSSPYFDNYVKATMITISKSLHNPHTDILIGVAGCDILLTDLINDIKSINYYDSINILVESDTGLVIANSKIGYNNSAINTYQNLIEPKITLALWNDLVKHNEYSIEDNKYIIQSVTLQIFNKIYILIIFVPKNNIYKTYQSQIDDLDKVKNGLTIVLSILFPLIAVLVNYIVYKTVDDVTLPLENMITESNKITQNLGKNNIYEGVVVKNSESAIAETKELEQKFSTIVNASSAPKQDFINNPHFRSIHIEPQLPKIHIELAHYDPRIKPPSYDESIGK